MEKALNLYRNGERLKKKKKKRSESADKLVLLEAPAGADTAVLALLNPFIDINQPRLDSTLIYFCHLLNKSSLTNEE